MQKDEAGKPKYTDPTEITDIAGITVVGCTMSDIEKLSSLVERYFEIDRNRS